MNEQCSEVCDPCEYGEHKKCIGTMHEGERGEHPCWCPNALHRPAKDGF